MALNGEQGAGLYVVYNQRQFPNYIEWRMMGVSLFRSAYGLEKLGYIAVVDLGHEIFIWFIFLAALMVKRDSLETPGQLLESCAR